MRSAKHAARPSAVRRAGRFGTIAAATTALLIAGVGAWAADTVFPDGDTGVADPNLAYGSGGNAHACSTLGTAVAGNIRVSFNGNGGTDHFSQDGEHLTVTFTADSNLITAAVTGTTPDIPSTWGDNNGDFLDIPFTTTVDPSITDDTYHVGVEVKGQSSGYIAGDGAATPGKPTYQVIVGCNGGGGGTGTGTNTPPTVNAGADKSGDEGSAISLSDASASDADNDTLGYTWTVAPKSGQYAGTPTPGCSFSDASALNPTITCTDNGVWTATLSVNDGHNSAVTDAVDVTVGNVKPTIGSVTGPTTVLTNTNYTYTANNTTDPSTVDSAVGFTYAWNGGSYGAVGANTFTTSFSTCGSNSVSATARDKDLTPVSDAVSLSTISAYDGGFRAPITQGIYNSVPKGYVLPVKITVGCGGVFNSSLTPEIQLYNGDQDPATDSSDPTALISPTTSASNADTTGVMRLADGQYIYNLQIPAVASVGQQYTVVVWPFGSSNPTKMRAVLRVRK